MSLIKRDTKSPTIGGVFANLKAASKNVVAPQGELFLLLDRSGSMAGVPLAEMNRAARVAIDEFLTKCNITVIPFDRPKLIPANAFVKLSLGGGTPMGAAMAMFAATAPEGSQGILMSDGQPTDEIERSLEVCIEKKLVIHTVACGSGADEELLRDIAWRTGGTFQRASEPVKLTPTFLALGRKAVAALTEGRKELPK